MTVWNMMIDSVFSMFNERVEVTLIQSISLTHQYLLGKATEQEMKGVKLIEEIAKS